MLKSLVRPVYVAPASAPLNMTASKLQAEVDKHYKALSVDPKSEEFSDQFDTRIISMEGWAALLQSPDSVEPKYLTVLYDGLSKLIKGEPRMESPLKIQLNDLRSAVSNSCCKLMKATSHWAGMVVKEKPTLNNQLNRLLLSLIDEVLARCAAGKPISANQAIDCLLSMCASSVDNPPLLSTLVTAMTDNGNDKITHAAIRGLVVLLHAGDLSNFKKKDFGLLKSAFEACIGHRSPDVKLEVRKLYCAMESLPYQGLREVVDKIHISQSELDRVDKIRDDAKADWVEGGQMFEAVRTGIFVENRRDSISTPISRLSTPAKVRMRVIIYPCFAVVIGTQLIIHLLLLY